MQDDRSEELHISKLEIALVVGVIGCCSSPRGR